MDYNKLKNHVEEHKEFVRKKHHRDGDIFFTALQGSQNYGLADDKSDVDTKTLLIPNLKYALFEKPVTETNILDNNEHADVKDIREMFRMFEKQNTNFIEILFTPYVYLNRKYLDEYVWLMHHAEKIAFGNPNQTVWANLGHIREKIKKFDNSTVGTAADVERLGYDPKQLHHMYRLKDFLSTFVDRVDGKNNRTYKSMLCEPTNTGFLMKCKRGHFNRRYAESMRSEMGAWADWFEREYGKKYPNEETWEMKKFFQDLSYELIKKAESK